MSPRFNHEDRFVLELGRALPEHLGKSTDHRCDTHVRETEDDDAALPSARGEDLSEVEVERHHDAPLLGSHAEYLALVDPGEAALVEVCRVMPLVAKP